MKPQKGDKVSFRVGTHLLIGTFAGRENLDGSYGIYVDGGNAIMRHFYLELLRCDFDITTGRVYSSEEVAERVEFEKLKATWDRYIYLERKYGGKE